MAGLKAPTTRPAQAESITGDQDYQIFHATGMSLTALGLLIIFSVLAWGASSAMRAAIHQVNHPTVAIDQPVFEAGAPKRTRSFDILSLRMVDPDTYDVTLDLGFDIIIQQKCRIVKIDAPEKGTKACDRVKEVCARWLEENPPTQALWSRADKYQGRFNGDILSREESLSDYLLSQRLVRPYKGEARSPWTQGELKEIEDRASNILKGK